MTKKNKAWTLNFHFGTGQIIVTENTPEMVGFSCWEMTGIRAIVGKSDGLVKDDWKIWSDIWIYSGGYRLGWSQKIGGYSKWPPCGDTTWLGCFYPQNPDPARQLAAQKVGENGKRKGGKEGGNITGNLFFFGGGVKTEGVFFFHFGEVKFKV